jgi:alpha-galactosidase
MDPLSFWRGNDAPDRQGMTEIRYIEGLYEMWDELRARHPGLIIDNCSSGGRRIDLEMCSRSVPLWRSDTNCSAGHADWSQAHTSSLDLYVPLHTATAWIPTAYDTRSCATGGLLCEFDYLDEGFPVDRAAALIAEAKEDQKYWYGDFYALMPTTVAPNQMIAYQFHRPDLDAGLVLAFRRAECNYLGLILELQAVDPGKTYAVELIGEDGDKTTRTMSGADLKTNLELRMPKKTSSLIVRYAPVGSH